VEKVESIEGETSIACTVPKDFASSCVTAPAPVDISLIIAIPQKTRTASYLEQTELVDGLPGNADRYERFKGSIMVRLGHLFP
jgi:hypothetical protein